MSNLLLDSLEISSFRSFRHLRIERLGRVNLIVGKNNVGKTSLLEALRLYADRGHEVLITELLTARRENRNLFARRHANREDEILTIKYLFYGRGNIQAPHEPIRIGKLAMMEEQLSVDIGWAEEHVDQDGNKRSRLLEPGDPAWRDNPRPRLVIQLGNEPKNIYPIGKGGLNEWRWYERPELKELPYIFVPANGLDEATISRLWDNTALTDWEEDVLQGLRIIVPNVERLNLVGEWTPNDERLAVVRLQGQDSPIPLRSMGEGMSRIFGLALALVNSEDGFLLVDEIDSGLHYSVQLDMWRLIFQTARRLNVQVFATTHSWDCIEAFQRAAVEDQQEEGMLIRLEERKGEIVAVPVSERELAIVTRDQIEVR